MRTLLAFIFSAALSLSMVSCSENEVPSPATDTSVQTPHVQHDRTDEEVFLIRGHIRNTTGGGAISGASADVLLPGQSTVVYSATSASDGSYAISNVAKGSYTLRFSASGYVTKTVSITLNGDMARADSLVSQ